MDLHWHAPRSVLGIVLAAALITAAATLVIAVSATGTAQAAETCTDSWKAPVNGDWKEPAKWSTGSVPSASDEVCITVAGTYTVTAESSSSSLFVQSLTVGPASGAATLSLRGLGCTASTNFNAAANITTHPLGTIQLTNANGSCSEAEDVNLNWGGTFANAGKITVAAGVAGGTRELEGTLTNTGTISVGVSTSSNSILENKGAISLANEAILSSAGGTLTNGTGGSVTDSGTGALLLTSGTFNQGVGSAGTVFLDSSALNLLGAGAGRFAFEGSDSLSGNVSAAQSVVIESLGCFGGAEVTAPAGFTNAGLIDLTNTEEICAESEPDSLSWSGTLTNTGTLTSDFGAAGGTRTLNGNLTNSGAVNINSDTSFDGSSAVFTNKKTVTVANGATLSTTGGQTFTDATGGSLTTTSGSLDFQDTIFNVGAGSPGSTPVFLENTSKLNLVGATAAGTFVFRGSNTMTGNIAAGQSVVIESVGCFGGADVTASAGFTNAGLIDLTNTEEICAESEPASLFWSGTLANTGTLTSDFGAAGGTRTLNGSLSNSGTVNINSDTSFGGSSAVFSNTKTVTVANGATLSTTGGQTFTDGVGGSLTTTSGSLDFQDTIFNVGAGSPGSAPVLLENSSKLNLSGSAAAGTFVLRGSNTMTGNVAATQSVVLQSVGCLSSANVTASAGFTNAGSIDLTNVRGSCAESGTADLEWSGTMTNTGTLTSDFGAAGGIRRLNGNLTNSGAVDINTNTSFGGPSALFDNKKTVALTNHATLSTTGGQTFNNDIGGSISTTSGGLLFQNTVFDVGAGSPGSAPVLLASSSTLNLKGNAAGTFVFHDSGTLNVPAGTIAAGQSVVVQGVGCASGAFVTAPAGFTNAGSIDLTNAKGSCAGSQAAQLEWSGTITNTGTLTSDSGVAGGTRTLNGNLTNSGAVNINANTSFGSGSLINNGTLTLSAGKTLSLQSVTFTQGSAGNLVENIASASSFGKLRNPSASDSLAGKLTVNTTGGYSPPRATKFQFMTFSSKTGTFASSVFNGHAYSVKYDSADVTLSALDNTTTTVALSPTTTQVGNAVSATATVTGPVAPGNPTGTITFSTNSPGTFTSTATCTLAATTAGVSACSVTYTPSAVETGTHTIGASYPGDGNYFKSSGSSPLTVTTRTTATAIACTPPSVGVNATSECKATVTDNNPGIVSTPSGSVTFSSNETGAFSAPSCTLAAESTTTAACTVSYTPSAIGTGTHKITGGYGGDATHAISSGETPVTVTTRTTGTTLECGPTSVAVGVGSSCTATVTDTNSGTVSTPTGKVSFSSNGAGSFSATSCTLAAGSTGTASCAVTYTPSAVGTGTHTITGSYGGDATHTISSGETPLAVTTRTTATTVSCTPTNIGTGAATSCKATVTDTNPGTLTTPTGSVAFSSSGAGTFTPATSCTLVAGVKGTASCSVNYTPSAVGTGTHTITGSYAGDANHTLSSGNTSVTVFVRRSTSTVISCSPASVAVGAASSCKATVTDTATGTPTTPTGTVKFTSNGTGSFAPASSCTLATESTTVATCTVSYTPSAIGTGTHTITGSYSSDAKHAGSSKTTPVTVTTRTTAATLECSPTSVAVGVASSCTATVTDTNAGTVSTPSGTVSFSSNEAGSFTPATSCTLVAGVTGTASCSVTYTPSAVGTGTHTITGGYGGDPTHAISSGETPLTVT